MPFEGLGAMGWGMNRTSMGAISEIKPMSGSLLIFKAIRDLRVRIV